MSPTSRSVILIQPRGVRIRGARIVVMFVFDTTGSPSAFRYAVRFTTLCSLRLTLAEVVCCGSSRSAPVPAFRGCGLRRRFRRDGLHRCLPSRPCLSGSFRVQISRPVFGRWSWLPRCDRRRSVRLFEFWRSRLAVSDCFRRSGRLRWDHSCPGLLCPRGAINSVGGVLFFRGPGRLARSL